MPSENKVPLERMGVTATIVFACEAHREAWLRDVGYLGSDEAKDRDYQRRRQNTDLV